MCQINFKRLKVYYILKQIEYIKTLKEDPRDLVNITNFLGYNWT